MTVPTFYPDSYLTTDRPHVHYQTSTGTTYKHIPMIDRVWRSSLAGAYFYWKFGEWMENEWHLGKIEIDDRCMELSHWPKFRPGQPTYNCGWGLFWQSSKSKMKLYWLAETDLWCLLGLCFVAGLWEEVTSSSVRHYIYS